MLSDLIARYRDTKAVWEAQWLADEKAASDSPEWHRYMELSSEIIDFRCTTVEEVSSRAQFMLSDENLVDLLANCESDAAVRDFLSSMCFPVEKSNIGEN